MSVNSSRSFLQPGKEQGRRTEEKNGRGRGEASVKRIGRDFAKKSEAHSFLCETNYFGKKHLILDVQKKGSCFSQYNLTWHYPKTFFFFF